ncbi:MAG: hypothetical protein ACREDY_22435 [Bradyrhizobium sp.]
MTREHVTQTIYIVVSLSLAAGTMLAGATWYTASAIHAVAEADSLALLAQDRNLESQINSQIELFKDAHAGMMSRMTAVETQDVDHARAIDHLSVTEDQLRAAITDLATAVTKLESIEPARRR